MNNFEFDNGLSMVRLGDDADYYNDGLTLEEIELKKRAARLMSVARQNIKLDHCFLCGKKCSSFCNSHSVPQFVLSNIADNGMTATSLRGKMLFYEKDIGINSAGTFHIICKNCDNESFQEYEDQNAYLNAPTNKMLAQMALKNYLLLIDKKINNQEVYNLLSKKYPESREFFDEKAFIEKFDFDGYLLRLKYAQKAIENPDTKSYHLCYHQILDYVVPFASQCAITLVSGFNDEIINNVYKFSKQSDIQNIHVAVFPLKTTSVVMLFIEEGEKKYRNFYRQLKKLPLEDQLSAINYIIFAYTEDVYLNPKLQKALKNNKDYDEVCRLTTDTLSNYYCSPEEQLSKSIAEFSLSKRKNLPNLLSKEYALSGSTEVE